MAVESSRSPRGHLSQRFRSLPLMFKGGRSTGVIDFDTASPGPRIWDMAYPAYRSIPLTSPDNPDAP